MRRLPLLLCLVLTACATPRASCLSTANRDLVALDQLIAQTEGNLARGYGDTREPYKSTGLEFCPKGPIGEADGIRYCATSETRYRVVPVAIDPAAERRKLSALQAKRPALAQRTRAAQSACQSAHPPS